VFINSLGNNSGCNFPGNHNNTAGISGKAREIEPHSKLNLSHTENEVSCQNSKLALLLKPEMVGLSWSFFGEAARKKKNQGS